MIEQTVQELSSQIHNRGIAVSALIDEYLQRIESNSHYQSIEFVPTEGIRILAKKADRSVESKRKLGRLHGVPVLVDDLLDVANLRTSYGSQCYREHVPNVDSLAVRRLRESGAIIMGKTKTSEFGLIQCESLNQYVSKSALGHEYVSGGGSSGMCVSLALNLASLSIGIDVGGNVLLPAAFQGLFAFRPTHGRIPHTPIYSQGMMFPDVVPVTRSVYDCALMMEIMSGYSAVDPFCLQTRSPKFEDSLNRSVKSLNIAHYPSLWNAPVDDDHRHALDEMVEFLRSMGSRVAKVRPPIRDSTKAWETIVSAELFAQHENAYFEQRSLLSPFVSSWIRRGAELTAKEYLEAQRQIFGLRALLRRFFDEHDIFLFAGTGCVPFKYGETPSNLDCRNECTSWQQYASGCSFGAISGFPVAHLPCGTNSDGLPVGLFVVAGYGNDDLVFSICVAYERVLNQRTQG